MEIDKQFFIELEEHLQNYADDEERYRTTFDISKRRPPEGYVILALRCMNFIDGRTMKTSVSLHSGSSRPNEGYVKIDFFPRACKVYFNESQENGLNDRMIKYMDNMRTKANLKKLDYTAECFGTGFCVHCDKKATKKHPDYEFRRICSACLKERNRFLVVVQ